MVIYVDIDETICDYGESREYPLARPIIENIRKINSMYDSGHTIVYWTARGTVTGIDWSELTKEQLVQWGAKHHKCLLGKPDFDLYICDKAISSETYFNNEPCRTIDDKAS